MGAECGCPTLLRRRIVDTRQNTSQPATTWLAQINPKPLWHCGWCSIVAGTPYPLRISSDRTPHNYLVDSLTSMPQKTNDDPTPLGQISSPDPSPIIIIDCPAVVQTPRAPKKTEKTAQPRISSSSVPHSEKFDVAFSPNRPSRGVLWHATAEAPCHSSGQHVPC